MAFDPDAYLAGGSTATLDAPPEKKKAFDPDAYLAQPVALPPGADRDPASRAAAIAARDNLQRTAEQLGTPHFVGTPNEPEGDRAPQMDMENIVGELSRREQAATDPGEKANLSAQRTYWQNEIAQNGMTAERWKKQTGEDDPKYPPPDTSFEHQLANTGRVAASELQSGLANTAQGFLQMSAPELFRRSQTVASIPDDPSLPEDERIRRSILRDQLSNPDSDLMKERAAAKAQVDAVKAFSAGSDARSGVDPTLENTGPVKVARTAADAGIAVGTSLIPGVGVPLMFEQDAMRRYAETYNATGGDEKAAQAAAGKSIVGNAAFMGQGGAIGGGLRAAGAPLAARITGATAGNILTGQAIKAAEGGNFNELSPLDVGQGVAFGIHGGWHGAEAAPVNKTAEIRDALQRDQPKEVDPVTPPQKQNYDAPQSQQEQVSSDRPLRDSRIESQTQDDPRYRNAEELQRLPSGALTTQDRIASRPETTPTFATGTTPELRAENFLYPAADEAPPTAVKFAPNETVPSDLAHLPSAPAPDGGTIVYDPDAHTAEQFPKPQEPPAVAPEPEPTAPRPPKPEAYQSTDEDRARIKAANDAYEAQRMARIRQQLAQREPTPTETPEERQAREEYEADTLKQTKDFLQGGEGNAELLDAVQRAGGMPSLKSPHYSDELAGVHSYFDSQTRKSERGVARSRLLRDDAPPGDELARRLRDRGFDFNTSDEVTNAVERSLITGQKQYANSATADAMYGEQPFARKQRPLPQPDLLSRITDDLKLVGERGIDHGARQAQAEADARARAEAQRAQDEQQQGFQFARSQHPDGVKSAAIRMPDGKIFEANSHSQAMTLADRAGYEKHVVDAGSERGFTTNSGEFLDRQAAFQRAADTKQIDSSDYLIGRGLKPEQHSDAGLESNSFWRGRTDLKRENGSTTEPANGTTKGATLSTPNAPDSRQQSSHESVDAPQVPYSLSERARQGFSTENRPDARELAIAERGMAADLGRPVKLNQVRFTGDERTAQTSGIASAEAVARANGGKVVWLDNPELPYNGMRVGDKTLLNIHATHDPVLATAIHELTHRLESDKPHLFRQIVDSLQTRETGVADYRANRLKIGYSERQIMSELIADAAGTMEGNKARLQQLMGKNPPLATRLVSYVKEAIDSMLRKLNLRRDTIPGARDAIANLQEVQARIVDAFKQARDGGLSPETDAPQFARQQGESLEDYLKRENRMPRAERIAKYREEQAAQRQPGGEMTGISQRMHDDRAESGRIGEVTPGTGLSAKEITERGQADLARGVDPVQRIAELESTKGAARASDIGLFRAELERRSAASLSAEEAMTNRPNDPALRAAYESAFKSETDWARRVKPFQTEASDVMRGMQGATDIDTGTFTGLRRAVLEEKGRDVKPAEVPRLKQVAERVQRADAAEATARKRLSEAIDRNGGKTKSRPKTPEELRAHFAERIRKLTPC